METKLGMTKILTRRQHVSWQHLQLVQDRLTPDATAQKSDLHIPLDLHFAEASCCCGYHQCLLITE